MFGDFEAQRHWMEITINLPPKQWYVDGPENDLQYWGLDYPPLSAHLSWAIGKVAHLLHPELVALHTSRGLESPATRAFMRGTVLLFDLLVFMPAVVFCLRIVAPSAASNARSLALVLFCPALLLVDHGEIGTGAASWAASAHHPVNRANGATQATFSTTAFRSA